MRYATYGALAALLLLTTCQKADVAPNQGLLGEWHWVSTTGGFTGKQSYTPASTGMSRTLVFRADGTFQEYTTQQGTAQLTNMGGFSLGSVKSIHTGQAASALILGGKQPQTFVIQELTTRLSLSDNYYDGFGQTYER